MSFYLIKMHHFLRMSFFRLFFLTRIIIHVNFLLIFSCKFISFGYFLAWSWFKAWVTTHSTTFWWSLAVIKWVFFFLYWHVTQSRRLLRVSFASLVILLQVRPFVLRKLLLNLFYYFLQGNFTSSIILKVIHEMIVSTELKYVA